MSEENAQDKRSWLQKVQDHKLAPVFSIGGLVAIIYFVLSHIVGMYRQFDDMSHRLKNVEKELIEVNEVDEKPLNWENCVELYKQLTEWKELEEKEERRDEATSQNDSGR